MEKLNPNDPETMSADIVSENLTQLKALFPEAFVEGKVDFDVLKQLLGGAVDEREEKYGLNWHGKRKARQLALTPSTGTLRPCPEDSVDWDTTQNLMIEGENLEVLKLLEKSYGGRIQLIYIDPPYNTGTDFVYPDATQDSIRNYHRLTGQIDELGTALSSNPEKSGRLHTDWLNMMYPRLMRARTLLANDGLIAIHIDENEYAHLETILNEVFGEENNLGTIVWDKRNPKGEVVGVAQQHELICVFARSKSELAKADFFTKRKENADAMLAKAASLIKGQGEVNEEVRDQFAAWIKSKKDDLSGGEKAYCFIDDDGEVYQPVSMAAPDKPETRSHRPLLHPVTKRPCPVPAKGWRFPDRTMDDLLNKGRILFGPDETTQPRRKYLLRENLRENFASVLYFGGSDEALGVPFDNPKPLAVACKLIEPIHTAGGIVLDFFAGSGTTGHAVMSQNASDEKQRRYILVQLPEYLDIDKSEQKAAATFCDQLGKPRNIAELTKERLRRAARKVKLDSPSYAGDLGFRVLRLDTSNMAPWDAETKNLEESLLGAVANIKDDRTQGDLLCELLLKLGLDLCVPIEEREIVGKAVHSVGAGALMVCLAPKIDRGEVESLALGIVEWHKELDPAGESSMVFLDSAFADDVSKTNMTAILGQHGLLKVRSL